MMRKYDLSGIWGFDLDPEKTGEGREIWKEAAADTICLPGTTAQAKKGDENRNRETGYLTELYPFTGWAWYRKTIMLDAADCDQVLTLTLERTRMTRLWVNGRYCGACDSLTTPHIYDLTGMAQERRISLVICVSNVDYPTGGGHLTSPDTQTNWNGIIGALTLTVSARVHLEQVQAFPSAELRTVTLRGLLLGAATAMLTVSAESVSISETGADVLAPLDLSICADEKGRFSVTIPMGERALLWSEYTPVFYRMQLQLAGTSEYTSIVFGLRDLTTVGLEFRINGLPVFLRGKHDGMIFPLTGAAPTDLEEWLRILGIAKRYGINHYRYHTCCPPEAAFAAADLLGIYMQPELPFWGTLVAPGEEGYSETEQSYLIAEGYRMMAAFGNHPSFCALSLGNELWGSSARMAEILRGYRAIDRRHLYTQGSNNFQFWPVILEEDDFFSGVRCDKQRLFRGSYAMCDAPLGHVQTQEPGTRHNYDALLLPQRVTAQGGDGKTEIEIQFGTGIKKVQMDEGTSGFLPDKPVVSHEIGQYAVYPDFREIEKYTGVLQARNFEIFRERLDAAGMLGQAEDFFRCSGQLAAQCYKEELEAAMRSQYLAGYQLLDIQDFSGQGTALVGMLDAFMDSKGIISEAEWGEFCSDAVLLAQFDGYNLACGDCFCADIALRTYRPNGFAGRTVRWTLGDAAGCIGEGTLPILAAESGLLRLGQIAVHMPETDTVRALTLRLQIADTAVTNHYILYLYPTQPALSAAIPDGVQVVFTFAEAKKYLAQGARVLFLPHAVKQAIAGFYCTDFWCYPMFRSISESMGRAVPVGTMGLCVQKTHPAVVDFTCTAYSTPQWYSIVSHADCAILDDAPKSFRPIVQMIDNFERNHKLGILFETAVGAGSLLLCTSRLSEIETRPEVRQFAAGLLRYAASDAFAPEAVLSEALLASLFN